jgi:hypothetical protein
MIYEFEVEVAGYDIEFQALLTVRLPGNQRITSASLEPPDEGSFDIVSICYKTGSSWAPVHGGDLRSTLIGVLEDEHAERIFRACREEVKNGR